MGLPRVRCNGATFTFSHRMKSPNIRVSPCYGSIMYQFINSLSSRWSYKEPRSLFWMKPRSPNTTWLVLGAHTLLSCFIWFWVGLHYVHMLFPLPSQSPPAPAHQTTAMCLLQVSTLAHAQTHAPATQIHVGNWLLPRASLFQLCPSVSGISTSIGPSFN